RAVRWPRGLRPRGRRPGPRLARMCPGLPCSRARAAFMSAPWTGCSPVDSSSRGGPTYRQVADLRLARCDRRIDVEVDVVTQEGEPLVVGQMLIRMAGQLDAQRQLAVSVPD